MKKIYTKIATFFSIILAISIVSIISIEAKYNKDNIGIKAYIDQYTNTGKYLNNVNHNCNIGMQCKNNICNNMINLLPKQDISNIEKTNLLNIYDREQLTISLYNQLNKSYSNIRSFNIIANAINKYKSFIKDILDKYNITPQTKDISADTLYKDLIDKSTTQKDSLITAINLEIQNIKELIKLAKETDNDDIKMIVIKLGNISINHINNLYSDLKTIDPTNNIDVSNYIEIDNMYIKKMRHDNNKMITLLKDNNVSIHDNMFKMNKMKNKRGCMFDR